MWPSLRGRWPLPTEIGVALRGSGGDGVADSAAAEEEGARTRVWISHNLRRGDHHAERAKRVVQQLLVDIGVEVADEEVGTHLLAFVILDAIVLPVPTAQVAHEARRAGGGWRKLGYLGLVLVLRRFVHTDRPIVQRNHVEDVNAVVRVLHPQALGQGSSARIFRAVEAPTSSERNSTNPKLLCVPEILSFGTCTLTARPVRLRFN